MYEHLALDSRVVFAVQPPDMEAAWKRLTQSAQAATSFWTDASIAALALLHNFRVVSFDKRSGRIARLDSTTL